MLYGTDEPIRNPISYLGVIFPLKYKDLKNFTDFADL